MKDATRFDANDGIAMIDEAITMHYGPRCIVYEQNCVVCEVWKTFETLTSTAQIFQNYKQSES